jgi:hypothetical protein
MKHHAVRSLLRTLKQIERERKKRTADLEESARLILSLPFQKRLTATKFMEFDDGAVIFERNVFPYWTVLIVEAVGLTPKNFTVIRFRRISFDGDLTTSFGCLTLKGVFALGQEGSVLLPTQLDPR